MEYEVQIWYDSVKTKAAEEQIQLQAAGGEGRATSIPEGPCEIMPENEGRGFDFVKFAEASGAMGERVFDPNEIKAAFKRGVEASVPYVIDIILERDTDCSMGAAIDAIREFE
jgi:thiamine pyrophosphate-dependent acetolactate synthase large subunit-like protein